MNIDDLYQMYKDTLIMHRNKPVFVKQILDDGSMRVIDLLTQKTMNIEYSDKNVKPVRRIGMVNINDQCLYVDRLPVRKYWASVHKNNITVDYVGSALGGFNYELVSSLQHASLSRSILNQYPTFQEALSDCISSGYQFTIAFDKQFATNGLYVYYKTKKVGNIEDNKIVFDKDFQHLHSVLKVSYET